MVMMARRGTESLRDRGERAEVSVVELFFDLVYVFAVIQLSHALLHDLSALNALHTVVLWFAVWLGWQYTCWVTNWFDPDTPAIRSMLFALMGVVLVMAAAIPHAFDHRAVIFAGAFVSLQVGRTAFVLLTVGRDHELSPNFTRMLAWLLVSAALWVGGAFTEDWVRLSLWGAAVLVEYLAPMIGFAFPLLGRSSTREWTIDGGHLAERCRLFVIVAFGETILSTGAQLSDQPQWSAPIVIAAAVAFGGVVAAWWIYFGTSSADGSALITRSDDPGRIGAKFHYTHVVLVGGIIVCAVANALVLADPAAEMTVQATVVLVGGPAIYLLGSLTYHHVVYQQIAYSHVGGLVALAALAVLAPLTDRLMIAGLTLAVLATVAVAQTLMRRQHRSPTGPGTRKQSPGAGTTLYRPHT
ncbi:low temperature requirement protein A [Mycobacterium sp. ITM-2016-00316]|uniref:low temperature requirement protein A n=1 Tax=Mycobacterium sp. ITM-2016-00316 TaxID=2099695 RepID=UPI00287FEEB9|nr:low temperature requirement protein A [Mycobacterium sp. ITM-2016-00316]WNG80916.1 low temperature requirement protein A [Mycobacterium sp. ITM-2016-00316]